MNSKTLISTLLLLCMATYCVAQTSILNANMSANNGSGGIFMRLTTNGKGITITKFNTIFASSSGSNVKIAVYTRAGDYAGNTGSDAGWTLVDTVETVSRGTTTLATLDVSALNISIAPSSVLSIYLHSVTNGGGIRYYGTSEISSNTDFSDSNLALFSDVARTGNIAFGGSSFTPRAYAGSIEYTTLEATLPLKWLTASFNATSEGIRLLWTVEESDVRYFEIERGTYNNFTSIATIASKGNGKQSYTYVDKGVPYTTSDDRLYYRIKEMDNDGKWSYSDVMTVNNPTKYAFPLAYPNPFRDKLTINSGMDQKASIIDNLGNSIPLHLLKGENTIYTSHWPSGIYILRTADGKTMKLLKPNSR